MENKERFVDLLQKTGRRGIEKVLAELDRLGFYTAPASTRFHGSYPGGLLAHSLGVYDEAVVIREAQLKLKPELGESLPMDSLVLSALLHDVCKAEVYKVQQKWKKGDSGKWESYDAYGVDYTAFPLGHGEKSVIQLLRWGLELTEGEIVAIRWHMSGFDLAFQSPETRANFGAATEKCPLLAVLRAADGLASHILGT